MKYTDISGQKFNELTVIEIFEKRKNYVVYWKCLCDCGKETIVAGGALKAGTIKRCKYCGAKHSYRTQRRTGTKNINGTILRTIKHSAKLRHHDYNLTPEYLEQLLVEQNFKCKLSGLPIYAGYKNSDIHIKDLWYWTASLDRIDSTKGYIEGNVQWVLKDINMMKQKLTQKEFIHYCKLVVENTKNF